MANNNPELKPSLTDDTGLRCNAMQKYNQKKIIAIFYTGESSDGLTDGTRHETSARQQYVYNLKGSDLNIFKTKP